MLATLGWKELREIAAPAALALAVQFYLLCAPSDLQLLVHWRDRAIPFVGDSQLMQVLLMVSGASGFVLGLWQTVWEEGRGTFLYLLHRPLERRQIVAVKLAVGWGATLAILALPLAGYALWAATPGTHASPFQWSMTAWASEYTLRMPLVYLGAFLAGMRPGRWFGSRLLPVAAGILALLAVEVAGAGGTLVGVAVGLVLQAAFVAAIVNTAETRDYA